MASMYSMLRSFSASLQCFWVKYFRLWVCLLFVGSSGCTACCIVFVIELYSSVGVWVMGSLECVFL